MAILAYNDEQISRESYITRETIIAWFYDVIFKIISVRRMVRSITYCWRIQMVTYRINIAIVLFILTSYSRHILPKHHRGWLHPSGCVQCIIRWTREFINRFMIALIFCSNILVDVMMEQRIHPQHPINNARWLLQLWRDITKIVFVLELYFGVQWAGAIMC